VRDTSDRADIVIGFVMGAVLAVCVVVGAVLFLAIVMH